MATADVTPRMTLCLAIDLKKSTVAGLRLSTRKLDRFNLALVRQVTPHLSAVGLDGAVVKFTGDGWLVITDDPEHAAPLCCLAIIMACRFRVEMSAEADLHAESIPALRLAVCWGRDLPVELPGGQRDFVGDSVRHAVRACQLCHDDEILVDDTVLRWVHHDFVARRLDLPARRAEFSDARLEEDLSLHTLSELKVDSAADHDAPEYFVNTLSVIGRGREAAELADDVADTLQDAAVAPGADAAELTDRFNRLLASNLDYETVNRLLRDMREAGLRPDVSTYNAVLAKSRGHEEKFRWLQRMKQDGITPDVRTFTVLIEAEEDDAAVRKWFRRMRREGVTPDTYLLNRLIDQSPDHDAAVDWLRQIEAMGVRPSANTYDLLIEKAPDIRSGMLWIDRMFATGIQPSLVSFKSVFAKKIGQINADDLLAWFLDLPYHPPEAMWQAIAAYRRDGRFDDALRLCLDYPQTQAAQRVFRSQPEKSLAYFERVLQWDPDHANGAYALGMALLTLGRNDDALPWLRRALELADAGTRREELRRRLELLEAGVSPLVK
jgi:class 3 adenylate cyclase